MTYWENTRCFITVERVDGQMRVLKYIPGVQKIHKTVHMSMNQPMYTPHATMTQVDEARFNEIMLERLLAKGK